MGDLYSSAIGTTVLRLREMPKRPAEYDGKVSVYNERSYDGRSGEAGRDDDDGRGW